ncbi:MAG: hypothetical protein ABL927_05335 [Bdellovibrionales bacterium]
MMSIREFILIYSFFLQFSYAQAEISTLNLPNAEVFDRARLELVKASVSAKDFNINLVKLREVYLFEKACQLQMKAKKIPTACFKAQNLASKVRILSNIHYFNRWRQRKVEESCLEIAAESKETNLSIVKGVDRKCAFIANNRIRLNRYKLGIELE